MSMKNCDIHNIWLYLGNYTSYTYYRILIASHI